MSCEARCLIAALPKQQGGGVVSRQAVFPFQYRSLRPLCLQYIFSIHVSLGKMLNPCSFVPELTLVEDRRNFFKLSSLL